MLHNKMARLMPAILIDATPQAQALDMPASVGITTSAACQLKPPAYLRALGLSFNKRIINLLTLVQAQLQPGLGNQQFCVSLCLTQGPVIEEHIVDFSVHVNSDDNQQYSIIISSPPSETEERNYS